MQTIRSDAFLRLYREFLHEGLIIVVLKGIIVRSLYPQPDNRPSNDEDLYVEKDMRYKAFFKDTYYVNKATSTDGTAYTWEAGDAARFGLSTERVGNAAYNITLGDTAVYISRHTYTQDERDRCRYAICNVSDNYIDPARPGRFFPSLKKMDCPSLYAGTNPSKPYSSADCIIYRLG